VDEENQMRGNTGTRKWKNKAQELTTPIAPLNPTMYDPTMRNAVERFGHDTWSMQTDIECGEGVE
jgi:hypothetical protein